MTDQQQERDYGLRFGISTLLLAVALVAILMGHSLYEWYTSTPLSDSVAAFNATASDHPVGRHEPPITEKEIVSAIRSQLPTLRASDQVKAIYTRIAQTRRLPRGASLSSIDGYSPSSGEDYTVWWINLSVVTGPQFQFSLRIRANDNPVAADKSKPLER